MKPCSAFAIFVVISLSAPILATRPATAASAFDGDWSVVVITDRGSCDRAYRYPVRVVNGVLRYDGEAGIAISGKVDRNGRVTATISRGAQQQATGSGRLTRTAGAGQWRGRSQNEECSGRWEAQRRAG